MKKNTINILFAVALVGLFTGSCKKYLNTDSPSVLTQESIFSSVSNMNSAVIGIYAMLIGDNGYGSRIATLFPQSADDMKTSGDYNANDRRGISTYGATSDNADLKEPFNQLFKGIERANICIKYIPKSDLYANGTDVQKATLQKLLGEALTLRAQFFYEAIRNWGDMPAQFEPSADVPNLYLPRVSTDTLYDVLLEDLRLAAEYVPWRTQSPDQNLRLTKGAVKGLRARIALARGGYSLRGDTHKNERRADYKKYYQIAYDECKDIMAHPEQHSLNPVYENIFKTLHTAARLDDAHELIFEIGAYGSNASTDSKLGYYNGLRHDAKSRFGGGGGGINIIPTYFYEFDSIGDCRRDVTINVFEIDSNSKKWMNPAGTMTDGKFRRSWTTISGPSQNLAINWPILRFADILLMYAEADNEINNGPSADAITAYERVRRRAFVGFESRMGTTPTDKDGFFNAIVQERLLEFGGEGIRKYDLIRWNLLGSRIEETKTKLRDFMNGVGRYASLPLYVYTKPANYNLVSSTEEVKTLDFNGGMPISQALFTPGIGKSDPPSGYTTKNWRTAVNEDYITGNLKGYARYFEAEKKELMPIPNTSTGTNYNMAQNWGY
ncbi:carbohydrate-binding protein SusD [Niastella yeongjuensis]|uniref:Carbohydrate-binding protein SusD n=1 Tax=Niastella yeongjuensis TaxID=354355 RepID=A0A1V9EML7_9BACT|nr:RagB/SusD family nutrient uptake outer membrane protein [Niastella yeongjuensis]OQP47387.1 carbohydrate-binding protein SusD [Niastella yeongjuensis]SEN81730.1 Starch-binding associating with outer membrane [Niastella yeongjuensis]